MSKRISFLAVLMCVVMIGTAGVAQKKILHMYTALDVNEAKIYIETFEKSHPDISVKWVRLSAGEVLARIRAEGSYPTASIWLGGSSPSHIAAAKDGLLEPYFSRYSWALPLNFKDPEARWVGIYTGFIGFASNTDFLKKYGIEAPTSWQDLLKSVFRKEIAMAYAYTSGTAYTTLATIIQLMGEEKGFEYVAKFNEQIHHYTRAGSACVTEVGLGEVAVGLAFSHDIVKKGIAKGYPVTMSFPKEGTGYEIGAMSLIKGGPEPELAKVFYDWLLTPACQNLYKKWFRVPLAPGAITGEGVVTADKVNLIKFDSVWAGENRDRLTDKWREVTKQ
ncbi:MAG: ABC transporter substrate-binding protein [Candidatus Aerophobetes bacterium]|nr:ABC transporter substrate-binding protein [Candidatus Aerophobetes bacterium]